MTITIKGARLSLAYDYPEGNQTTALTVTGEKLEVSDGYHTIDELYEHRFVLWIALCRQLAFGVHVWKSKLQSDGTMYDGWFLLGISDQPGEQTTYHLPIAKWDDCDFAETLERSPEFDGHTSADVLERLKRL